MRKLLGLQAMEWLALTTAVSLIHHADHVLRYDHSGWPFRDEIGPFTYSLSVYAVVAIIVVAAGAPWLRAALAACLFLFATIAHTTIETPLTQYATWCSPEVNLLGVNSPALGVLAGAITVLLSASALATAVAFALEARSGDPQRAVS